MNDEKEFLVDNSNSPSKVEREKKTVNTQEPSKIVTREQVLLSLDGYFKAQTESQLRVCKTCVARWIQQTSVKYTSILEKYNVVYLMTNHALRAFDSDTLYEAIETGICRIEKPVLLILQSYGGRIEPAYFIGKMLRKFPDLDVAVPRMAKSAATLICCAATRIHMGGLSELGPIDPQINGVPALGLKNAIQHLASLTVRFPEATGLFVGYMCKRVEPMDLGYYERVVESSMQYAERLLTSAHASLAQAKIKSIAQKLTYEYKDHGFVVDRQEADEVFPENTVCSETDEYRFSDIVYKELEWLRRFSREWGFEISLVGCGIDALRINAVPRSDRS